jgi:hypothetical protein
LREGPGIVLPLALEAANAVPVDDVFDAAIAAWSAARITADQAVRYPDPPQVFSDRLAAAIHA